MNRNVLMCILSVLLFHSHVSLAGSPEGNDVTGLPTVAPSPASLETPQLHLPYYHCPTVRSMAISPVWPSNGDPSLSVSFSRNLISWNKGRLYGYTGTTALPGLMGMEHAGFTVRQQFGPVTLTLDAGATRYGIWHDTFTRPSIGGKAHWHINDRLSVTVFGNYSGSPAFYGPAALPYIGSSGYGGYLTVGFTDNTGMAMGVRREYDASTGRWITVPIAAPYFNAWGQTVSVDFGGLLREIIVNDLIDNDRHCPVMAPPKHVTPVAPHR